MSSRETGVTGPEYSRVRARTGVRASASWLCRPRAPSAPQQRAPPGPRPWSLTPPPVRGAGAPDARVGTGSTCNESGVCKGLPPPKKIQGWGLVKGTQEPIGKSSQWPMAEARTIGTTK